jgi:Glycoside hydrolase family 44
MSCRLPAAFAVISLLSPCAVQAAKASVTVKIDVFANRHAISPMIYGVSIGTPADLKALNAPLNRQGGNNTSTYNWEVNANNLDFDWYFESYPFPGAVPGGVADTFIQQSKADNATAMLTMPMIGWVAKLGPHRAILPSFSVKKYGPQCATDPYDHDAGDGRKTNCTTDITGNDPNDAYVPDSAANEGAWVQHLIAKCRP